VAARAWPVPAARRSGGGGGPVCRGRSSDSLLRRHACLLVTVGPTATCQGAGAGLGRTRGRAGTDPTGGPLDAVQPAGTRREEGRNSRALGACGASGNAGHGRLGGPERARGRCLARRDAVRRDAVQDVSVWLRSTAFFPKFLNRSALNNE
jgi:hypothetical protein